MDQFNRCLRYAHAFCHRTTAYFWLIVNKSYALNTRSSVKKELQEKVLLHPLPVAAQVAEAQAVALAAGAVLLAVAARPVAGNSTIKMPARRLAF